MIVEPILRPEDHAAWQNWMATARMHARTRLHRVRVDRAKRVVAEFLSCTPDAAVMWSGGKDSTAMTYLVCVELGHRSLPVYSEKDDLDYPGEREYVERLAAEWRIDLRIIEPPTSPLEWVRAHRDELVACDDLHSRAAGLSKECFYGLVEAATAHHEAIMLGLRAKESRGRLLNRKVRGDSYRKRSGQWVCTPIVDWRGLDVMAYLASREIDVLPVYRCIAFAHAREPWMVRKSWWLPGHASAMGGMAWLRHYWPSLYEQAKQLVSHANLFT